MKDVFKKAHKITKNIIRKGDSYRETFRLALIFVYSETKKGANKMVELIGTEKQVKWADNIREQVLDVIEVVRERQIEIVSKRPDKVKKDGTVITSKDRIRNMNERFDELVEDIKNINNSVFFIENFSDITSKTTIVPFIYKKTIVHLWLNKTGNKMERYF